MLACIIEIESRAWRDGMIEGLTRGHALAAKDGLGGEALRTAITQRFNELTPPAYHSYIDAYQHQGYVPGVHIKLLSFWQWRTLAADLAEIAAVTELLGCTAGFQEEEARCALLLDDSVPGYVPYQSLVDHGGPADPAPHFLDGLIDGYNLCWQFLHDDRDSDEQYVESVMEYLDAFWPEDYKLYRYHYERLRRPSPSASAAGNRRQQALLEYGPWSGLANDLAAEIERCTAAGEVLSRKWIALSRRLLLKVEEPAPSLEWSIPPRIEKEMSW